MNNLVKTLKDRNKEEIEKQIFTQKSVVCLL
jgi:hypothetical protein